MSRPSSPSKTFKFPVTEDDRAHDIAPNTSPTNPYVEGLARAKKPPLPPSDPSTRDSSPAFLSPLSASRRGSQQSYDLDSRRGSAKSMATDVVKDLRKGVKIVTDSTVGAGQMMKDKTAEVKTSVTRSTKDAGKWVATQSSQKAMAALEHAKSKLSYTEKFTLYMAEKITQLSRRGFTHLFMFLIMVVYTAIGAAIFMAVEGSNEDSNNSAITSGRDELISQIYEDTRNVQNDREYEKVVVNLVGKYEDKFHTLFQQGFVADRTESREWTFFKAMFFCSTISTTIGYGNVTPKTGLGQSLTIVYALIGIPLFLILLADFGKLFTRALKHLFILGAKVKKSRPYNSAKEVVQNLKRRILDRLSFITDKLPDRCRPHEVDLDTDTNLEDYFTDGNFNLPVSLALGILGLYIFIGSLLFTIWEDWTTFQAFYFIFISMTTIGFGDYVPEHPGFMMAVTVYLVFGLALTAMSINIIQEKLSDTFSKASSKLKEQFKSVVGSGQGDEEEEEGEGDERIKEEEGERKNQSTNDAAVNQQS